MQNHRHLWKTVYEYVLVTLLLLPSSLLRHSFSHLSSPFFLLSTAFCLLPTACRLLPYQTPANDWVKLIVVGAAENGYSAVQHDVMPTFVCGTGGGGAAGDDDDDDDMLLGGGGGTGAEDDDGRKGGKGGNGGESGDGGEDNNGGARSRIVSQCVINQSKLFGKRKTWTDMLVTKPGQINLATAIKLWLWRQGPAQVHKRNYDGYRPYSARICKAIENAYRQGAHTLQVWTPHPMIKEGMWRACDLMELYQYQGTPRRLYALSSPYAPTR